MFILPNIYFTEFYSIYSNKKKLDKGAPPPLALDGKSLEVSVF